MNKMGKVFVTGVAGFIGSQLAERLLKEGFQVIGLDHLQGNLWVKEYNLQSLRNQKGFTLVAEDLLKANLSELLNDVKYVFHCAATPGVRSSWGNNFPNYVDNNILATHRLVEAAIKVNIERFVYSSTSSVYGQVQGAACEDRLPQPLSPYGVTKLAGENLVAVYQRNFGLPAVLLRYFTVFGTRQRPDMAFHRFILACLKGQELKIFGDGNQIRDFTGVDDIVVANLLAIQFPVVGEIINIGGGNRFRINEAIKTIARLTGCQARTKYLPTQWGEPQETGADISKAQRLLQFKPQISLEKGLVDEINDLRRMYKV